MSHYARSGVRREALAKIIQRELDNAPVELLGRSGVDGHYSASVAQRISASGLMTKEAATRRIYAILNPIYENRGRQVEQRIVDLNTADKILTALDLTHLWHTELAGEIVVPVCSACGGSQDEPNRDCPSCMSREYTRRSRALRRNELAAQKAPPASSARPASRSGGATPSKRKVAA